MPSGCGFAGAASAPARKTRSLSQRAIRRARPGTASGQPRSRTAPPGLVTASAHSIPELRRAERAGATLVFVSPVFATRSHPGARAMGPIRLAGLVRATWLPVVALGGMTEARWRRVRPTGAYGWAAIDGLLDQKLMAVPR
nr:thiamine phosphate synthase [Hankyongella ginsenosidimutans]